jgi:hypothetical protein
MNFGSLLILYLKKGKKRAFLLLPIVNAFRRQSGFQGDSIVPWNHANNFSVTIQDYVVAHLDDFSESAEWRSASNSHVCHHGSHGHGHGHSHGLTVTVTVTVMVTVTV